MAIATLSFDAAQRDTSGNPIALSVSFSTGAIPRKAIMGEAGLTADATDVGEGWDSKEMLTRKQRQQVFLVVGTPWLEAIAAIRDDNRDGDPWQASGSFRPGDLLITVVDTDPRAVLCVERLEQDGPDDDSVVLGERRLAEHLPPVSEVESLAAATMPEHPGPIPARDADRLLDAIMFADMRVAMKMGVVPPDGLAEARTRLNARSSCGLCDDPVDPGDPAVEVHLADPAAEQVEDANALLCAACSDELAGSHHRTLVQHRLSTRHPQCPRCAAFQTLSVVVGGLQLPPDIGKWHPWEMPTTDVITGEETEWCCDACGYGWDDAAPRRNPDHPIQRQHIQPLWQRNEDNRIVLARKSNDTGGSNPVSVLCAPLEPSAVMRILAAIVATTFGGNWNAALATIVDQPPHRAWEFLDQAVNSASKSIGDRTRDVLYRGDPDYLAVPGVGIAIDYAQLGMGVGDGIESGDYFDVMYGFLIDDAGAANVLAAQIEHEVTQDGQAHTETEEVWNFLYTLSPGDYLQEPQEPR